VKRFFFKRKFILLFNFFCSLFQEVVLWGNSNSMAIIISLPEEVRHISNIANNFRDGNDVELKESLLAIVENESSAKTTDTTKSASSAGFYTSQSNRGAESLSFCGFCSILASASVQVIVHSRRFFFHSNFVTSGIF